MRRSLALLAVGICISAGVGVAGPASAAPSPGAVPSPAPWTSASADHVTRFPGDRQLIRVGPAVDGAASRRIAKHRLLLDPGPVTARINVTYTGFPVQAREAFQAAVDTWAHLVHSPVPIEVEADWSNLTARFGPDVLGAAGPTDYVKFTNSPIPNVAYPIALADAIAGKDLLPPDYCTPASAFTPTGADISASFNSNPGQAWYFGTDGQVPNGQVDLESVVLHELGHGLGFAGTFEGIGATGDHGLGFFGLNGDGVTPNAFDAMVSDASGTPLISYPNASQSLGAVLRGGRVNGAKWNGDDGKAAFAGNRVPLYSPNPWQDGSSFSHLDEDTPGFAAGTANSLMTPVISPGEAQHDPGPVVLGMFQDMGWPTSAAVPTTVDGLFHPVASAPLPRLAHQIGVKAGRLVDVPVRGQFGVPDDVTAVTVNVEVRGPSAAGYWTALPGCKGSAGSPSVASYTARQARTSQVTLPLSPDGHIALTLSAGTAEVNVDLVGWYSGSGDYYHHLPAQLLAVSTPISAARNLDVPVAGLAGVPPLGATAVVLKARVSKPTVAGWLRIAQGGVSGQLPSISFAKSETTSTLVTVPLGTGTKSGLVHLQLTSGKANVSLEAVGWYGPSLIAATVFHSAGPARYGRVLKGQDQVAGGLPGDTHVMLSVHVANPTGTGLLTAAPAGPGALHGVQEYVKGRATSGLLITTTNSLGQVRLRLTSGSATMYVDWLGYFAST